MGSEKKSPDCSAICFICSLGLFGLCGSYSFPNFHDLLNYKENDVELVKVFINNFSYVNNTNQIELTFYGKLENNLVLPILYNESEKNYTFLLKNNNERKLDIDFKDIINKYLYMKRYCFTDYKKIYLEHKYDFKPELNIVALVFLIIFCICGTICFCCCCCPKS